MTRSGTPLAMGYLRGFVTVLVVAHHSVLAYYPFAPPQATSLLAEPRWWQAFPVVDSCRFGAFALFAGFNDVFFMALMFFLSGLFVWKSLERKDAARFATDRALRLGVPFVVVAALVAPLAYYPAYRLTGADPSLGAYWHEWRSLGNWPAGPGWFLWVLLTFDVLAAGLFALAPRWGEGLGHLAQTLRRPAAFFAGLVLVSAAVYVPLVLAFGPLRWTALGPFAFQTSRILLYAVYFLAGLAVGTRDLEQGLLAPDGALARRWVPWVSASVVALALVVGSVIVAMTPTGRAPAWAVVSSLAFVLSCAASGFAFLALFVRFVRKNNRVLDSLAASAYGIYLLHYAFVSWLQYALLAAPLPGLVKGVAVTLGALLLSWGAAAALRRSRAVARLI